VHLSILESGRARAVRFPTLSALCEALGCQPGDLIGDEGGGAREERPLTQITRRSVPTCARSG
jgi:hypothetical protein